MAHERLSVHNVTFYGATPDELVDRWETLGVHRLSVLDSDLLDPTLNTAFEAYRVEAVYHLFAAGDLTADARRAQDGLNGVIDAAAAVGARMIYLLTGNRGDLSWDQAAARFSAMIAPSVEHAARVGVRLAIENASALYADLHMAHTLRDTVELADRAGVGICVDVFHCWAEADFPDLVRDALPRVELIQLSDYVLGDRALPARAVPGDGAIPLEDFVKDVLGHGYQHGFDLELIGPRISAEGAPAAAQRACDVIGDMITRYGG